MHPRHGVYYRSTGGWNLLVRDGSRISLSMPLSRRMESDRLHACSSNGGSCPDGTSCETIGGVAGCCPDGETCSGKLLSVHLSHVTRSVTSPPPQYSSLPSRYLTSVSDDIPSHRSISRLLSSRLCPMPGGIRLLLPRRRSLLAKCIGQPAMRRNNHYNPI
jgi:hypothetical protein